MRTDVHVLPVNDIREHVDRRDCWCQPRLIWPSAPHESAVVIHHALDARELIEQHGIN